MEIPWAIKKEDFPNDGQLADKIKFALRYAILAPSTHNSQPWLFKIKIDSVEIFYDFNLKLPEADPLGRDLYISLGCMIENLSIAANYFGIFKDLKLVLTDNRVAEVYFQDNGEPNKDLGYLVDAIPKRINVRGIFENKPLPEGIQSEIMTLKKDGRVRVDIVTNKGKIEKIASLTAQGLRLAYKRPSFRKEMSSWMFNNLSKTKKGLPGYSLRMPFLASFIIPTLVKFFDISWLLAKLNHKSMSSAPLICIFSSEKSDLSVWFEIGRLAQRCMLQLNSEGIKTSIFVASIEMSELYKEVQKTIDSNLVPQFIFCAGYMKHIQPHSPRQNLEKVLL